jgi:hypothetical protein
MYVVVQNRDDLLKLPQLSEKRNILVRFKMNGCSWCVSSQPEWDSMVKDVKGQLSKEDAIAEVESEFVDHFKDFVEKTRGESMPPVQGFPSVMVIRTTGISNHEGRDKDSYVKVLEKIKSIPKSTRKTKKTLLPDPRLKLIQGEQKPIKKRNSRNSRNSRKRRSKSK